MSLKCNFLFKGHKQSPKTHFETKAIITNILLYLLSIFHDMLEHKYCMFKVNQGVTLYVNFTHLSEKHIVT